MKHHATLAFWKAYGRPPEAMRHLADRNFELLKVDAKHPSLHFKPVGRLWSARISLNCRALAVKSGDDVIWFWIGNHADYDRRIE